MEMEDKNKDPVDYGNSLVNSKFEKYLIKYMICIPFFFCSGAKECYGNMIESCVLG